MKLSFRLECSEKVGAGHLARCSTLAHQAMRRGDEVEFLVSPESRRDWVENRGFRARTVPADAIFSPGETPEIDLLVVDHYGIDARLESAIPSTVRKVLVVDDLANRPHVCDGLLDHNAYLNADERYRGLLTPRSTVPVETLLGARFALIRDGFRLARAEVQAKPVEKNAGIWVNFGGGAVAPITLFALQALDQIPHSYRAVTVVSSDFGPFGEELKQWVTERADRNWTWISHLSEPEFTMKNCSVALGSGGVSALERAMLGLPSFVVATYSNQLEVCENLARQDVIRYAGTEAEVRANPRVFREDLERFLNLSDEATQAYRSRCLSLVDGQGVSRVMDWVEKSQNH